MARSAAAIRDVEGLRRYIRKEAPFLGDLEEQASSSASSFEGLLPGGFPKGGVTVLSGVSGAGRMTLVTRLLAEKTQEGVPVAWIDGRGTLYPPALAQMGVRLERVLMVHGAKDRTVYAVEQIISSGAFGVVVASGLDRMLTPTRARRLQTATEGAKVSTLLVVDSGSPITNASLKLRLTCRHNSILVDVVKDRAGRAGRRAVVPVESPLLKCA